MRLLTHNLLQCHARHCNTSKNFPLQIVPLEKEVAEDAMDTGVLEITNCESKFCPEFLVGLLTRLDWKALIEAADQIGVPLGDLPRERPEQLEEAKDENILRALHRILLEVEVVEADLQCKGCGHRYRIRDGIPNMLLDQASD